MLQSAERLAPEVATFAQAAELFCLSVHRESGPELAADLVEVSRCIDLLHLKFSEMAAAFARTDHYDLDGSYSSIHWIRVNCHMSAAAAADRVTVGEQVPNLPESTEALADGDIGFAHLALIAREAEGLALSGSNNQFPEKPLLDKARDFTVGRFRNFCHHQRHSLDPCTYAADEAGKVEARSLDLKTGEGGMLWLRGVLDPGGGNALLTALEPLAHRSGRADDRKRDRRLADALVELAMHGQQSHLHVTASLETLLQRPGAPAAEIEFSQPLSSAGVERIACDCNVTRILLDSQSQVIDVGRSKRVISPAQRRALAVRDRTCRWPGCDRPASYTAGHHLVHWSKGGSTDLDNLVLLCRRHHWMVHEGGWQIVRAEDGRYLVIAPLLDAFQQFARGPGSRAA